MNQLLDSLPGNCLALLTPLDWSLIRQELVLQEAETQAEEEDFARAYAQAKYIALNTSRAVLTDEIVADFVLYFAKVVYPRENKDGLRTFQAFHGKTNEPIGTPPGEPLANAISRWCLLYAQGEEEIDWLYQEFERIHPLNDGNGRLGMIFRAMDMYWRTRTWPTTLPPEFEPRSVCY